MQMRPGIAAATAGAAVIAAGSLAGCGNGGIPNSAGAQKAASAGFAAITPQGGAVPSWLQAKVAKVGAIQLQQHGKQQPVQAIAPHATLALTDIGHGGSGHASQSVPITIVGQLTQTKSGSQTNWSFDPENSAYHWHVNWDYPKTMTADAQSVVAKALKALFTFKKGKDAHATATAYGTTVSPYFANNYWSGAFQPMKAVYTPPSRSGCGKNGDTSQPCAASAGPSIETVFPVRCHYDSPPQMETYIPPFAPTSTSFTSVKFKTTKSASGVIPTADVSGTVGGASAGWTTASGGRCNNASASQPFTASVVLTPKGWLITSLNIKAAANIDSSYFSPAGGLTISELNGTPVGPPATGGSGDFNWTTGTTQ